MDKESKEKNIIDFIEYKNYHHTNKKLKKYLLVLIIICLIPLSFLIFNSNLVWKIKIKNYGKNKRDQKLISYINQNKSNYKKENLTKLAVSQIIDNNISSGLNYLNELFFSVNDDHFRNIIADEFKNKKIKFNSLEDLCDFYIDTLYLSEGFKGSIENIIKLYPPDEVENYFILKLTRLYEKKDFHKALEITSTYKKNNLGSCSRINTIKVPTIELFKFYNSLYNNNCDDLKLQVINVIKSQPSEDICNSFLCLIKNYYFQNNLNECKKCINMYSTNNLPSTPKIDSLKKLLLDLDNNTQHLNKIKLEIYIVNNEKNTLKDSNNPIQRERNNIPVYKNFVFKPNKIKIMELSLEKQNVEKQIDTLEEEIIKVLSS